MPTAPPRSSVGLRMLRGRPRRQIATGKLADFPKRFSAHRPRLRPLGVRPAANKAEVASFSFPLAVFVFGVPVSQKDIPSFAAKFVLQTGHPTFESGGAFAIFGCVNGSRPFIRCLLAVQRSKAPFPCIC